MDGVRTAGRGDGHGLPRVPIGFVPPPGVRTSLGTLPSMVVFRSPRGYGKTSTASYWLRHDAVDHVRIWVNVPNRPTAAAEFWPMVHRRVRDAGLGDLTAGDTWDDVDRALYASGRQLVLAIDGLQHVDDAGVDEELASLVGRYEAFHLFVMTRDERPVETFARLADDGQVFRLDDMSLTAADVAAVAEATGMPLSGPEADLLHAELLGWPALVRAVLIESTRTPAGALDVDWSPVEKYVRLAFEDRDLAAERMVLCLLAVPEEFTKEVARHLLDRESLERFWERYVESGALLRAVDPDDGVFRYPPVLREAVLRVFREHDADAYRRANRAMATWYRTRGNAGRALEHAVRAADWDLTAAVIEAYWVELVSDHPDEVRGALAHLPAETVRGSARLLVARDYILNVDTDERSVSALRAGLLDVDSDLSSSEDIRLSLGQVLALRSTGQYETARAIVERQRVDLATEDAEWTEGVLAEMPELLLQWSITRLLTADTVGAAYAFREAYRWARERDLRPAMREAGAGLALGLAILGHTFSAERWLTRVEELAAAGGEPTALETMSARLVRETVDLDMLRLDVEPVWREPRLPLALKDLRAVALELQAARAMHADGRFEMIGVLETFRQHRDGAGELATNAVVPALVDLLVMTGQPDRARQLLSTADRRAPGLRVAHARRALFAGEFEEAVGHTDGLSGHTGVRPRLALHLALIRASACHRLGLTDQAADALHLAISVAEQTGILRAFLLVPRADLEAIGELMPQAAEFLYRPELLEAAELLPSPHEAVRLSERELRVLEEIAPGISLAHAARRLFVSENTIKTQMRNIYRKLGVHTRDDAIDRAREVGLLPPEDPPR